MLKGIRVLDFCNYVPGPYASMRLADLGAEVIKVEPLTGDLGREIGANEAEKGIVHDANNRHKKSIAINLKTEEGLKVAEELVEEADVLIESFRPGVMKRLGLGYKRVKDLNSKLVYCSLSGYGQSGLLSKFGSHDLNYLAISGLLSQFKDQEGRPVHPTITLADLIGGIAASEGVLAALVQRSKTDKGQYVDATLVDSSLSLMNNHMMVHHRTNREDGYAFLTGELICYNIYETKDERFISLGALEPNFWENFCKAVGREDWIEAHFTKAIDDNVVYQQMKDLFLSKTLKEWTEFSLEVDCCMAPILEVGEVQDHPYIKERGLINEVNSSLINVATRFQAKESINNAYPPGLSEDAENLLVDLLGYSNEDVTRLQDKKIVGKA